MRKTIARSAAMAVLILVAVSIGAAGPKFFSAFSYKELIDYREQNQTLEDVVEHHTMRFILLGREEPERVQTAVVSANFFDLLGVKPLIGRTFIPSDEERFRRCSCSQLSILGRQSWRRSHYRGPDLSMNDRAHTVIGVLPPIPQYPNERRVYMPTVDCPTRSSDRLWPIGTLE